MTSESSSPGRVPIEELIAFPTSYGFKAVGLHKLPFPSDALEAVRTALGPGREVLLRTRLSSGAKYISATLTAVVESADELKRAYAALRQVEGVITVL